MSVFFSCSLFYLSFFPLWISVLFIDIKSIAEGQSNCCTEYISIILILIFGLISGIILYKNIHRKSAGDSQQYFISKVTEEKTITAEFLLSYILPLFAFDFTKWDSTVLFLVFFLTLGFLCVKHNYFSVNIILELFKYRFYNCLLENSDDHTYSKIIISRRRLNTEVGKEICLKPLNNEYMIEREVKDL